MKKAVLSGIVIFSILFTLTTLLSSIIQLTMGQSDDSNIHILMRSGFVLIATITMVMFFMYPLKNVVLRYVVPYIVAQALVFLMVFLMGLATPLHPDAYRDGSSIFLRSPSVSSRV